jgi:hypothetical protein
VEVDFDDDLVAVGVALPVVDVGLVPGQYSVAVDSILLLNLSGGVWP